MLMPLCRLLLLFMMPPHMLDAMLRLEMLIYALAFITLLLTRHDKLLMMAFADDDSAYVDAAFL